MKKGLFFVLFAFTFGFIFGQQNTTFSEVKDFYDVNIKRMGTAYHREYSTLTKNDDKALLSYQFDTVMAQVDSMRNQAYITALIQTKNAEQLAKLHDSITAIVYPLGTKGLRTAMYPGGIKAIKKQLAPLIDFAALKPDKNTFQSQISFVVELDGNVSNVSASGMDLFFNRELEIAVYLLPQKFTAAKLKGQAVRSEYGFPYVIQLD